MSFSAHTDQPRIVEQLQRSLQRRRLAHAYLFVGPRGSGKLAVALTLAKALNCEQLDHDSCDRCESCRRIDERVHPDIRLIEPELKSRRIGIDQIREFSRAANLKAGEARIKVGIIVDADRMGEEASNAFLKTLEEPPANTIILLLTAEPQRLLPTILSRCLKVVFGPTERATGSPHRARVMTLLAEFAGKREARVPASYQLLSAMTGILRGVREEIQQRVESEEDLDRYEEIDAKTRERLENLSAARIEGEYRAAREQVLEDVYRWFGDLMLCVVDAEDELLSDPAARPALQTAAKHFTYEQACAGLDAIERARDALHRNVQETFALEVGFLNLAR